MDFETAKPLYLGRARNQSKLFSMSDATMSSPAESAPLGRGVLPMMWRRILFGGLVLGTMAALMWLTAVALSPGGIGALDVVLLVLFAITLPWMVIGLWNAIIGFLILRFAADPVAAALPAVARVRGDEPITESVALLACIRNEGPARVLRNLTPTLEGLAASGAGGRFHLYLLSDTDDAAVAAAEEAAFGVLEQAWRGRIAVTYRRRAINTGFKAGNLHDFCRRYGDRHTLGVTLDADSYMPAAAVLRMVRVMQVAPEIGILQGLVVAMPSASAFARLFQFGMRLGMRSYTVGSAWWQGDCGPHWGHNSILRLAPFTTYCDVAPLETAGLFGGPVLSHDQIEAVLMRRAGYEVRVLPEETLGFEENPPTLMEFIRRDLRWCQGNLQYARLLSLPGLKPVSRYQLVFALLMFVDWPAWIGLLVVGTLAVALARDPGDVVQPDAGAALLAIVFVMWFGPIFATLLDVLTRGKERRAFGGGARLLAGIIANVIFTLLLWPIRWFSATLSFARLVTGSRVGWGAQSRDDHAVPFALALRSLWPHTLLGVSVIALLAVTAPAALPYALLIAAGGLALSAPFAVLTANAAFGAALARRGIGALPEEIDPGPLRALMLPPLAAVPPGAVPSRSATPCSSA
jgi:membrane glycosyltransferase